MTRTDDWRETGGVAGEPGAGDDRATRKTLFAVYSCSQIFSRAFITLKTLKRFLGSRRDDKQLIVLYKRERFSRGTSSRRPGEPERWRYVSPARSPGPGSPRSEGPFAPCPAFCSGASEPPGD